MRQKPWDFMAKDTPSRDWTEGLGALITVAFFCGGIAGGLYLYSLYTENHWGMLIGWSFALLMGVFDLIHLHNKKLVWRMILKPNSSWISRGFLFVILFIGTGAIHMALVHWFPGNNLEIVTRIISGIAALGVAAYSGFVVSYVSSVKFWHSAAMPALFIVAGLAGGAAILLVINAITGNTEFVEVKNFALTTLLIYAGIIAMHLWISTYNSATAKRSVMSIVKGELAVIFWVVIVFIGIVVPVLLTYLMSTALLAVLVINAACILSGNLALRYVILKAGRYSSLLPE